MDAIESLREMCERIDTVEQRGWLKSFVENHLQKMNTPSEEGSSSSEGRLESVRDDTKLGVKTIDTILTEAQNFPILIQVKAIESVTLNVIKEVGDSYWVFIGVSVAAYAAYALENYLRVGSKEKECRELLQNILELAKGINAYSKLMSDEYNTLMSDEQEKLRNAVGSIMEGTVILSDYLKRGNIFRFWSPTRASAKLAKTNQQLRDVTNSPLSSLERQWDKDVFLIHSGEQKEFALQLYQDLTRAHVSCFFDEDDNILPLSQKFPGLLSKAAETCKTIVVVLSHDFIGSKWPMLELSAFIRTKKTGKNAYIKLIPIFFKISPKALSRITKDHPEWKMLEENNIRKCEWQYALKEVRSINGILLAKDGNEVECKNKVVKEICRSNPPRLLDFEPVGIEEQAREVKELLDMEGAESALAVMVCGFGGVGKSTVAASLVQSLDWFSTYKFCWVSIDEKAEDKTSHILELQKDIINDLQGVKPDLQNLEEGRVRIKEALKEKCSLLFIDNVVDKDYVRDLLPKDLPSCEQETKVRIIITSREEIVQAELEMMSKLYEVKSLSDEASKGLLSKTILQNSVVMDKEEEGMINEVSDACRGVPLLLSIFGKHLRAQRDASSYQKENYQEVLEFLREGNLDKFGDEDIGTRLLFMYDKIEDVDVKEAFLDICTYFHGLKWNLVADIVDSAKLEDLRRRMLVSKGSSGSVIVPGILRFMGMRKAKLTRFSNHKELSHALEGDLDGFDVKGISLLRDNCLIESTTLEAMHKSLRVLILGDLVSVDRPCEKEFTNLRYLHVGDITRFPFKDPTKLDKLGVFLNKSKPGMSLSSLPVSVKRLSHEVPVVECDKFEKLPIQNLSLLKSLVIKTQKSVELPEELHLPSSLVDLDLSTCKNMPKEIGHLTALDSVILDRSDLESLPRGFGKLKKLKHLSMNYCSKLALVSEDLGMLSSLTALRMMGCGNLRALPENLGLLTSLQTFELSKCIKLEKLPESFGELHLQSLNLHSVNLNELPNSFGNMTLLKDLSLKSCHSLVSLPKSFVQLKLLETLKIEKCPKLSHLPEDFGRLRCLKTITVEACHLLKELPHGFAALPALKTFSLTQCNSFVLLPSDFGELASLEELYLTDLLLMSRIPHGLGKLKKLRVLNIQACFEMIRLPDDFENMATLEKLYIKFCLKLHGAMMEKILKLPNCYIAHIDGSPKLSEKWKQMQGETEHQIVVASGNDQSTREEKARAIRVALLHGKCMEVNNATDQLVERSSLLLGLEEGTTVALIMLPIHMQSHQQEIIQRFVEKAEERSKTNGRGKLQIVCARKVDLHAERPTEEEKEVINQILFSSPKGSSAIPSSEIKRVKMPPIHMKSHHQETARERTEEYERAEEDIRQILLLLPKGSCAIPSSECKRVKMLTHLARYGTDKLSFFMANVGVDIKGRKIFENLEFTKEDEMVPGYETESEISGNVSFPFPWEVKKAENKDYNSIQKFIKSICPVRHFGGRADEQPQSQCVEGES